jgi:TonB family protein
MKTLTIVGLLSFVTLACLAQTSETKYYKGMPMDEEVPKEKAKYSVTTTNNPDGSVTTERKNLKKNLIENRQVLKGEEPVGIWIYLTGHGPAEMDFNFNLEYTNQDCPGHLNIKNYFADEVTAGYECPKISTGEEFYKFLAKNIVYPAKARREGLQGKVDLTFDLTKDGTIEIIRVRKGLHVVLDKEAVRVLRKMKFSSPPKINGQPQTLCASTSIVFRLA